MISGFSSTVPSSLCLLRIQALCLHNLNHARKRLLALLLEAVERALGRAHGDLVHAVEEVVECLYTYIKLETTGISIQLGETKRYEDGRTSSVNSSSGMPSFPPSTISGWCFASWSSAV